LQEWDWRWENRAHAAALAAYPHLNPDVPLPPRDRRPNRVLRMQIHQSLVPLIAPWAAAQQPVVARHAAVPIAQPAAKPGNK